MTWSICDGVNAATDGDEARFYGELKFLLPQLLAERKFKNAFGYWPKDIFGGKAAADAIPATKPSPETEAWVERETR